jgi:rod shape determining protein RodA
VASEVRIRQTELRFLEKIGALNWPLILVLLGLGFVGYLVLYSAGGGSHDPWAWRHGMRLAFGLTVMLAVALTDIRFWFRWAYAFYALAFVMLLGVEILGEINKGAQRWIDLGVIQLQPSELMKVGLVLCLARYFHGAYLDEVKRLSFLATPLVCIALPAVLVLKQPDLGTSIMLLGIGAALLFLAGVRLWKFGLAIGAVAAALPVAWGSMHDYQRQRVLTFLDPETDPLGAGYHIIQSKIALGSGGLWGKGFLQGSQAQLSFLPEKQTDFAFTMLAEETGFVGAVLVLLLCLAVVALTLVVALRCSHQFGRLLAMGIGINFFFYVVINVAMVTGLIPVVGVPLPMISYGGTAMMTTLLGFGLVLSVDVHHTTNIPRFPTDL